MRITSEDLRDSKIFMYYRVIRKWAAEFYKIPTTEVEFLMSLHCKKRFSNQGFLDSELTHKWDKQRFYRLQREGWITVYRHGSKGHREKTIYKVTRKTNDMVNKIYRIMLGEEEIPVNQKNPFHKNETYTDKVMQTAIQKMKNDYREDKPYY